MNTYTLLRFKDKHILEHCNKVLRSIAIIIWVRDLLGGQRITKKKSSWEESNIKLIETLINPSTNPWSILTKLVTYSTHNLLLGLKQPKIISNFKFVWTVEVKRERDREREIKYIGRIFNFLGPALKIDQLQ